MVPGSNGVCPFNRRGHQRLWEEENKETGDPGQDRAPSQVTKADNMLADAAKGLSRSEGKACARFSSREIIEVSSLNLSWMSFSGVIGTEILYSKEI